MSWDWIQLLRSEPGGYITHLQQQLNYLLTVNFTGLNTTSSPPFELPAPELPKRRRKNYRKSRAGGFITPERSRTSDFQINSSHNVRTSSSPPNRVSNSEYQSPLPPSTSEKSYYTAAWGSPYDITPKSKASKLAGVRRNSDTVIDGSPSVSRGARATDFQQPKSAGFLKQSNLDDTSLIAAEGAYSNSAAYDLTGNWLREYHWARAERKTWLSDGSDNSDNSLLTSEEEDNWPEFHLPTPEFKARDLFSPSGIPTGRGSNHKHKHLPSDATLTQEHFDTEGKQLSERQAKAAKMLSALLSGAIPQTERNKEPISEKATPAAPLNRTASEPPMDQQTIVPSSSHRQRPSVSGVNSFQRPKKKVVWKGKTCTIALPLENVKDSVGNLKKPLTLEDVAERLKRWELNGESVRGFDLSGSYTPGTLAGQSRNVYPDPSDSQHASQQKNIIVRIPDKQWWNEYVKQLQEAKLRALGVAVASGEPPVRSPSITSSMGRQPSSHSSYQHNIPGVQPSNVLRSAADRVLSPSASASASQFPFPHAVVSPNISSVVPHPAGYHITNQSNTFYRDRVFSPFSLTADSASGNGGTSYLGSMPNSRGVSPLLDDRRQSIRSINSPVSPLPEMLQNAYLQEQLNHPLLSRQRSQPSSMLLQDHTALLQQEVSKSLAEQMPAQFFSQPEIASPFPQGRSHRHNVSQSLQKEIDEAEYHLEASIARQLDDADNPPNSGNSKGRNLSTSHEEFKPRDPQEKLSKHVSIVSDIETNPSQGNTPMISTTQPVPSRDSGKKASVSKLNVKAQEFVFNPAKAIFTPMFTFGEKPPIAPLSTATTSTSEKSPNKVPAASAPHSGLNVAAPAFVPGKPFEPSPQRVFSFSSTLANSQVDVPTITPGVAFGEIPGGLMDKQSSAVNKVFALGSIIQVPKKTKAIPIVQPELEDDAPEDEEGRPMQVEGRQKRARRSGGSGHETPLFAASPEDIKTQLNRDAKDTGNQSTSDEQAGITKEGQTKAEMIEKAAKDTTGLEQERFADKTSINAQSSDSDTSPESGAQQLHDRAVISAGTQDKIKEVDQTQKTYPAAAKDPSSEASNSLDTKSDDVVTQDPDLPQALERLGNEEEANIVESPIASLKSPDLTLPSPLQHIPSSPADAPDTALNTADFLKTPAKIVSPTDKESLDEQDVSTTVGHTPTNSTPSDHTGAIDSEDPFTIGDHDEGNITDKSVKESQITSSKLNLKDLAKTKNPIEVTTNNDIDKRKTPDTIVKKSTLSATAKPFIFNPSVSDFRPESPKQQPVVPVVPSKRDIVVSELPASTEVALKTQPNTASSERLDSLSAMNDHAMSTKELPKRAVFSGGLGASRYAPEQPTQSLRQPSPPMRTSATPSEPMKGDTNQEEVSNRPDRPSTPEASEPSVEQTRKRVSSPELSPLAKEPYQPPVDRYNTPPRPTGPFSMEERIMSGVKYVEPSFNEIDDVMRQLNGDDSDIGVERDPKQAWRSPKAADRKNTKSPEQIATPESERFSARPSRIPTASPNHLDRPFQYLPKQDYGSSNTEDSKLRDAAAEMVARNARFSPSFKGQHHAKQENSAVHKLGRRTSGSISNWDDVVSSGEETDFQHRVGFFGSRVGHVITNAMDDRLQPIETSLAELTTALSKLSERSRSVRPRPSRSVESDADDEDDETGVVRVVSPFMKDRRFEKLRSILLDAVVQHNAPSEELSKILESVADLRTELSKRQEQPVSNENGDKQAISKLSESVAEIKAALSSQQVDMKSHGDTPVLLEQISTLTRTVTELQTSLAEHHKLNTATTDSIIETTVNKHLRGQSNVIKSSQESATVEKLKLQLSGLESLLKNAEERAADEYRLRRGVEDQLVESAHQLKSAIAETANQRDAAEETEQSLQSILHEHRQNKEHIARLEEANIELENNNSDLQAKNTALEDTIAEYRISHHEWRKDLDNANTEKQELVHSIKKLRKELEEGIASRQALKDKFERIENEMLAARHSIARDQATWRHKEEEHKAKHESHRARLEAEARTRERLELEIERLEKQEQEALKARSLVENTQSQNNNLAKTVDDLRAKENSSQERAMVLARELHDLKERSQLETQRLMSITQSNIESSSQQIQTLRADLEGVIHHLEDQLQHSQTDAKSVKERYQALLEEASVSRDTALREAAEARDAALQEHYRFHERTIHEAQVSHERALKELKADHARAAANAHEDHERAVSNLIEDHNRSIATTVQEKRIKEQDLNGRLALSNDKISHLQDKLNHLEDKFAIATSAAQAAAEAARSARNNSSSSPVGNVTAPSLRGFDPQALRQTVETLQDQLGERERQIEKLEQQLEEVDMEAPAKIRDRDAEITWLRELLGVRMDDMQELVIQLSTPHFDRAAVRDAVIRLRASLQMEQQERERQMSSVKFPSLSDIRASPKALPLAAAAAWGSWRKGQSSLSSLAEMAVPSGSSSADQTPSKSSPQSFLSGLLTPPNTNLRQTPPRGSGSLSRSARTTQRPLAGYLTPKRQISANYDEQQQEIRQDVPETPALLTQGSYDADALEGPHHYSLEQYVNEQADMPSEDNSQQGDNDNSAIVPNDDDTTQIPNPFGPSIELAG